MSARPWMPGSAVLRFMPVPNARPMLQRIYATAADAVVTQERLAEAVGAYGSGVQRLAEAPNGRDPSYVIRCYAAVREYGWCGRLQVAREEYPDDERAYADILGPMCVVAVSPLGLFVPLTPDEQSDVSIERISRSPYPIVRLAGISGPPRTASMDD